MPRSCTFHFYREFEEILFKFSDSKAVEAEGVNAAAGVLGENRWLKNRKGKPYFLPFDGSQAMQGSLVGVSECTRYPEAGKSGQKKHILRDDFS